MKYPILPLSEMERLSRITWYYGWRVGLGFFAAHSAIIFFGYIELILLHHAYIYKIISFLDVPFFILTFKRITHFFEDPINFAITINICGSIGWFLIGFAIGKIPGEFAGYGRLLQELFKKKEIVFGSIKFRSLS